ncbi:MAG: YlmH/Sll1252 family protein [Clostridiales bacterium]|nr:YlmH/Sll1252 family protein [Clostridiales bacterium]
MNEEELCKKRLIDLSRQADRKGIVLFSDFLNLNELNIYHRSLSLFDTKTESFGGVSNAERQIIAFIPDALYYDWGYPIAALKIVPAYPKFAEKLGHRDILGAIMSLGLSRGKIGDILVAKDASYLLCEEGVVGYLKENLDKIRHTAVILSDICATELRIQQNFERREGIVASARLDSVIACVYRLSRSQASELIRTDKVFVNGRLTQNPTYLCKEQDLVSVRGMGRFVYVNCCGETNKGRSRICYQLYKN